MTEVTRDYLAAKLLHWEQYMLNYELPDWKGLPDLELYMDQVVVLLAQYLNFIPAMPGGAYHPVSGDPAPGRSQRRRGDPQRH